jgi:hypothetical protein
MHHVPPPRLAKSTSEIVAGSLADLAKRRQRQIAFNHELLRARERMQESRELLHRIEPPSPTDARSRRTPDRAAVRPVVLPHRVVVSAGERNPRRSD